MGQKISQAAPAPQASDASTLSQDPMERAQSFLSDEGQRLEDSKFDVSPQAQSKADQINADRDAKNAQIQGKLDTLEQKRAAIESDPKLSPKKKADQLKKLDHQAADLRKQIKPHVDLTSATHSVVSKKYGESKKRVEAQGKAETQALDARIHAAEKAYGKKSPEVQALKAEKAQVKQVYSDTAKQLGATAKSLHKMFKPVGLLSRIGHALAKVGKIVQKIGNLVMPLIAMIPGVGQIVAAVWYGVQAVVAAAKGQWMQMVGAIASAIPAVGDAVAKVATMASKALNYVTKGINVVKDIAHGDVLGAISEGASMVGGAGAGLGKVAKVVSEGAKAVEVVEHAAHGDIAGALAEAGEIAGDFSGGKAAKAAKVLGESAKVANVAQQAAMGHYGNALSQAADLLPENARKATQRTVQLAGDGADAFMRLEHGDYTGASTALSGPHWQHG